MTVTLTTTRRRSEARSVILIVRLGAAFIGFEQRSHRVIVGDEIERLALFLQPHRGLHRPEVVADVEFAARLETGQNSHGAEDAATARARSSGPNALFTRVRIAGQCLDARPRSVT